MLIKYGQNGLSAVGRHSKIKTTFQSRGFSSFLAASTFVVIVDLQADNNLTRSSCEEKLGTLALTEILVRKCCLRINGDSCIVHFLFNLADTFVFCPKKNARIHIRCARYAPRNTMYPPATQFIWGEMNMQGVIKTVSQLHHCITGAIAPTKNFCQELFWNTTFFSKSCLA